MKKNTLRSLGLGFLSAAILTGAFAIFVQGNTPVEGIQVNGLLENNEQELQSYEEEVNSLVNEVSELESTRNTLNESLAAFSQQAEENQNEITSLSSNIASLQAQVDDEDGTEETETTEEETETETETEDETTQQESGIFEIVEGQSAEEIALDLEAEGFVESAEEFQNLLDEWQLHSVIQAGTFELNSEMTIHDIATIITNGAYFYY